MRSAQTEIAGNEQHDDDETNKPDDSIHGSLLGESVFRKRLTPPANALSSPGRAAAHRPTLLIELASV
jgi:hypothetical protein